MVCGASDLSFLSSSVDWVAHFPMYKQRYMGSPFLIQKE